MNNKYNDQIHYFEKTPLNHKREEKVAREIRDILSKLFFRSNFTDPNLFDKIININEVVVSKDLSHAKVYFSCFEHIDDDALLNSLNKIASNCRREIGKTMHIKTIPQLHFIPDNQAEKLENLQKMLEKL